MAHSTNRGGPPAPYPIRLFRRMRFRNGLFCPRCGHRSIHRWGRFGWRQRYRCLGCRRTFSDFTGTPLMYLKRLDLWSTFCALALDSTTIRRSAVRLSVHPSTCFRWRHRLLAGIAATERVELRGRIHLGFRWLPHSEKGSRRITQSPRRRRFDGLSFQTRSAWILVATSDSKGAHSALVGEHYPRARTLLTLLEGSVATGSTLLVPAREGVPLRPLARSIGAGIEVWRLSEQAVAKGERPPTVEYFGRVTRWMGRFCGVATRYLDHYLVWFRLLDRIHRGWTAGSEAAVGGGPRGRLLLAAAFP